MFYKSQFKYQLWRHADKTKVSPLHVLYEQEPFNLSNRFEDTRFLVLDCEMSGLDVNDCELLSIGWVIIERARIINSSSRHLLVQPNRSAGDSSKIHGLVDCHLAGASSAAKILMMLAKQMLGSVVVFHHAPLDIRFLQKAALENFHCPLLFSYIDTLELERQRLNLHGKIEGLQLAQCRERYGLPACVVQHNALADAHATAELFLAQANNLGDVSELELSDLRINCST